MQLKNKRVVLTGGCGFIGSSLIPKLMDKGISELIVVDKMSYASRTGVVDAHQARLYVGDIYDDKTIKYIYDSKPDIVINMAAESHVDNSINSPMPFVASNSVAVVKLLEGARNYQQLELFHQISTDEVYGSVLSGFSEEDNARICSSPYSSSKGAGEMFVEAWATTFKIPVLITRSSNNYGKYQHLEKFIPKAIDSLLTGKKVSIYGNGTNCRDWIHVEDNCDGLLLAIENGHVGETYNIGGNKVLSNNEIVLMLCSLLDLDPATSSTYVKDRLGHDQRYALNSNKLINLGWSPKVDLESGLKQTIEWYRNSL